ncbi:MAG: transcription antitermination protein NusB [Cytophagales bacterium]|nr:transcription antitermination protein NusB [Cytophagales bacterium]
MLNRRFLRIKALQAAFAYQVRKEANLERGNDYIENYFAPDLTAAERPDYEQLAENTKATKKVFAKSYQTRRLTDSMNSDVRRAVEQTIRYYDIKNREDHLEIRQQMVEDTENILKSYHHMLSFFVQLANFIEQNHEAKKAKTGAIINELELNFTKNTFVKDLRSHEEFEYMVAKYRATWLTEDEQDFLKSVYREILLKEEAWKLYQNKTSPTQEEDYDIILFLIKKILFKKELVEDFYQTSDLNWIENQEIVKSLCLKTAKKAKKGEGIIFFDLAMNWEDDKDYLIQLFEAGVAEKDIIVEALNKRLENWDPERVSTVDRLIMILALSEMMLYPSIPIKVTINEFIEVSKRYSSVKSKVFINGILDRASKDLLKNGDIRKSGRGLLDNK